MKSSTLFKIGFTGMGISVIAAVTPIVAAVLGDPEISNRVGDILNEKLLSIILIFFSAVILRALMVKNRESLLAGLEDRERHED